MAAQLPQPTHWLEAKLDDSLSSVGRVSKEGYSHSSEMQTAAASAGRNLKAS